MQASLGKKPREFYLLLEDEDGRKEKTWPFSIWLFKEGVVLPG